MIITVPPGQALHMVPFRRWVSAAIAGSRRSFSRQRLRVGPMLPTGAPSLALISVSDMGGSSSHSRQAAAASKQASKRAGILDFIQLAHDLSPDALAYGAGVGVPQLVPAADRPD